MSLEFHGLPGEPRPYRDDRARHWLIGRRHHGRTWGGKVRDGRPDFVAEGLDESIDGGNYVAAEMAVSRLGAGDWRLVVAAMAFQIAWAALRLYRDEDESSGAWIAGILREIRDQIARARTRAEIGSAR